MTQDTKDTSGLAGAETLRERYTIVDELGRGSQGKLFVAQDAQSGAEVAIKELDLKLVDEWKAVELFDREADALESLDHPGIPSYIDAFHQSSSDGADRFFLVQQYIDGTPLSEQIDAVQLMDEAQARQFLREMLSILDYLQSLNPPIVHRDIKPSNIIVRPDGSHALVDFGAVQTVLPETVGGSTVVGTTGFMPPEQLMGRATPASDIYALGATVVSAMCGHDPADLEVARMKLQFHDKIEAPEEWISLLDRMLDPTVETRLQDAQAVFEALADPSQPMPKPARPDDEAGALVAWEPTEARIAELENNPPRLPLSSVSASPKRLIIDVGPIDPPPRNWWMPILAMGLAIIIGVFTGGCLLVVTIPVAFFLIFKGMGYLRPVSERLEMTPQTLVIEKVEHKRIGASKVESHTFEVDQLYLPHVHRVSVDSHRRGGKKGAALPKVGKPGLIFSTPDGESVAFGDIILTQHRFIQSGLHDDQGELDWLDEIVTEYMTYIRGDKPDE